MKIIKKLMLLLCGWMTLTASATTEYTTIQGDHGKLAVMIQRPDNKGIKAEKKVPLLVLCHGFGASKEGRLFDVIADSLNKKGIAVLRFDFNGHGKSEGKFEEMTVPNEIIDAKHVLEYVSSLPWVGKVAMGGHSQGGVVTAMTSAQLVAHPDKKIKKIAAVVLMAPAAVLRDDALRGNTFGKVYDPKNPPAKIEMWGGNSLGGNFIRTAVNLPIYETAKDYKGPECIIHGDADRIVPYTYGQRFHYLNKKSEFHLLTDADHGFGHHEEEVARITSHFLAKVLK